MQNVSHTRDIEHFSALYKANNNLINKVYGKEIRDYETIFKEK